MNRIFRMLYPLAVSTAVVAFAACGSAEPDREAPSGEQPADWREPSTPPSANSAASADTAHHSDPATSPRSNPSAHPHAQTPGRDPDATVDTLSGEIALTGSEPMTFVTLQPEGRRAVQLLGPYQSELRRLVGAVVRVEGTAGTGRIGPALTVRLYEIVSIDGNRPYVGVLEAADGEYRLIGPQVTRVLGVPPELTDRVGATVWVVGVREGDAVRLQSYGIIRP